MSREIKEQGQATPQTASHPASPATRAVTPWRVDEDGYTIRANGNSVAIATMVTCSYEQMKANAAFIVTACNAHDGLVEALQLFLKQWNACGSNSDFGRYFSNVRVAAEAAVAKASQPSQLDTK